MLFLKTMMGLIQYEAYISELNKLIVTYESMLDVTATKGKGPVGSETLMGNVTEQPLIVKDVNHVSKKPRISCEFRINA